jgi:hypothetical protein
MNAPVPEGTPPRRINPFFCFRAVASQKDEKKTFLPRRASQGAPEPGSPHICDFILLV